MTAFHSHMKSIMHACIRAEITVSIDSEIKCSKKLLLLFEKLEKVSDLELQASKMRLEICPSKSTNKGYQEMRSLNHEKRCETNKH